MLQWKGTIKMGMKRKTPIFSNLMISRMTSSLMCSFLNTYWKKTTRNSRKTNFLFLQRTTRRKLGLRSHLRWKYKIPFPSWVNFSREDSSLTQMMTKISILSSTRIKCLTDKVISRSLSGINKKDPILAIQMWPNPKMRLSGCSRKCWIWRMKMGNI